MLRVESPEAQIAAVLHDVVEDGRHKGWTLERLRSEGFSDSVLSAVACLTKSDDEDYESFVERVAENPIATEVKIADLAENMDLTRLGREPSPKDLERRRKYERSLARLQKSGAAGAFPRE